MCILMSGIDNTSARLLTLERRTLQFGPVLSVLIHQKRQLKLIKMR